jgi:hypothetical protein
MRLGDPDSKRQRPKSILVQRNRSEAVRHYCIMALASLTSFQRWFRAERHRKNLL